MKSLNSKQKANKIAIRRVKFAINKQSKNTNFAYWHRLTQLKSARPSLILSELADKNQSYSPVELSFENDHTASNHSEDHSQLNETIHSWIASGDLIAAQPVLVQVH